MTTAGLSRRSVWVSVAVVGVVAGVFAAVELRNGVLPTWDTVSYWSGAEAIRHGDWFGSHLQPSFSNFTVIEFLERGGRLPFVDFPIGYPIVVALVGLVIGTQAAMAVWTVAAVAAVAALVCVGPVGRAVSVEVLAARALLGLGIVATSPFRVVTRTAMTEPLFCVAALGLVLGLLNHRRSGRGWPVVIAAALACGMLRFVGAVLVVLVGVECWRRSRSVLRSLGWAAVVVAPTALNAWWTSRAGGGHTARLHGISGMDVERFSRSVGGWVDARHANVALTFFSSEGARWWAALVAVVWLAAALVAIVGVILDPGRWMPPELELCLAAAGLLMIGLVAGMVGFDALLNPDNRVMLPLGVLTLAGAAWSIDARHGRALLTATAVWALVAVFPRGPGDPYFPTATAPATVAAAEASGAKVVVSPDADLVHWYSGLPAAYPPKTYFELTGEHVDATDQWAALPCALYRADAVLIVPRGGLLFDLDLAALDDLVATGALEPDEQTDVTVLWPSGSACAEPDGAAG